LDHFNAVLLHDSLTAGEGPEWTKNTNTKGALHGIQQWHATQQMCQTEIPPMDKVITLEWLSKMFHTGQVQPFNL